MMLRVLFYQKLTVKAEKLIVKKIIIYKAYILKELQVYHFRQKVPKTVLYPFYDT